MGNIRMRHFLISKPKHFLLENVKMRCFDMFKKMSFTTFLAENIWQTQPASMYKSFSPLKVPACRHLCSSQSMAQLQQLWSSQWLEHQRGTHALNHLALLPLGTPQFCSWCWSARESLGHNQGGRSQGEVQVPPLTVEKAYTKSPSSSSSLCPASRTDGPALCLEPSSRLAADMGPLISNPLNPNCFLILLKWDNRAVN